MIYLFSYDISNSKSRRNLSDFLIENGLTRIQKSVFIGKINSNNMNFLIKESELFMNIKKDHILVTSICSEDFENSRFLGKSFSVENLSSFQDLLIF